MTDIACKHCSRTFDEEKNYCPYCQTPTPAQQDKDFNAVKRKAILWIAGLAVFCIIMILWLPREL